MPTFWRRHVFVKELPGLRMVPSGIVASLIKVAASQRLTGTGETYRVEVAIDNVDVGVAVASAPGAVVEVGSILLGVVAS